MNSFRIFLKRAAFVLGLTVAAAAGLVSLPGFAPAVAEAAVVSSVVVTGNQRVAADTVRSYITIKPGKGFGAADIDESVKLLYGTGLFADVTISVAGNRLVVKVVESGVVNSVIIQGNKKIKSDTLIQIIETKPRGPLTEARLQGDVQRIKDYYATQGRSLASVDAQVTQLGDNRVDVVFVISEGVRTGVGTIAFIGNHAYSDNRLRSVINTKQHNLLSWLTRKDIYDEAKIAADQEALRRFYMSHGYADFRVISVDTDFNEGRGRYFVSFTIEEGPKYRFASIDVDSSIPGVNVAALKRVIKTRPGGTFNAADVEKSIENMTDELARQGFVFAQVRPRGDRNYDNNTISVTYLVDEGPRLYIERIDVYGNTKTRDYVIRREFDVAEGDAYNRVQIDKAERRLRNLGFFKTVVIASEPGSTPDRVVINVSVEEQSTGDIGAGAGISTDGFIAEVSLNERNFLGRGQALRIAVGFGVNQESYTISFTDPYFLGSRVLMGLDAFKTVTGRSTYRPFESDIIGGGVRLGLPITDDLTFNVNYRLSQQTITNTKKATSIYFPNGSTITSAAGYSLNYSTVDDKADPHNGTAITFSQEFAGIGGDTHYMRTIADARYYKEIFPDADVVGAVRLAGGNVTGLGDKVRILDNFFKGGDTIRGFATYGYGPVDKATDVPLGGKNWWVASAEVQFPLPGISPEFGLRGAVFADAGSLWGVDVPAGGGPIVDDNVIRSSVGTSILWASPVGVLRADLAYALTKAATDRTQFFRFTAGRQF